MDFYIGVGLVLVQNEKYILIQEVRNEKKGLYNLPAGTLESNEDLVECIVREAKEETGASVSPEHFVGVYQTVLKSGSNILFFVFAATIDTDATLHSDEHTVISAFSFEEIMNLDKEGRLRAPTVLESIKDYRNGQRLHLSVVQTWHLESLAAITVDKDH